SPDPCAALFGQGTRLARDLPRWEFGLASSQRAFRPGTIGRALGSRRGNGEVECCALSEVRFDPDPAAVTLHDLTADRQPHAVSGVLLARVQALKQFKDAFRIGWIY